MGLMGFQRRRRLARQKELEERKKQESAKHAEEAEDQPDEPKETLSIDDLKKDDIIKMLEERGIEHNPRDKKEVLFDLLVGD